MSQIYLALHGALAVLRPEKGRWTAELALVDQDCQSLAVDPHHPHNGSIVVPLRLDCG